MAVFRRCPLQQRWVHDLVNQERTAQVFLRQGPGGRSSVSGHVATVFGCTGFLGRYLVNNLGKKGTNVVVPFRGNDDERRHLKLMGDLGQIVPLRFDLRNDEQITECIRHSDTVYNLIGRDYGTKNFTFEQVHVDGARKIARIARQLGVSKLIHVSALGADEKSPSKFLRSKALGERAVLEEFPEAIIVRPAQMYGHEDKFWNRIGWWVKWWPFGIPIVNGGKTRIRPVFVPDVAAILAIMLNDDKALGRIVELAGPKEYHYASIVEFFLDVSKRQPFVVYLPKSIAKFLAGVIDRVMAYPVVTPDEFERACIDDVVTPGTLTFTDFNIKPHTVEETIIRFVRLYRPHEYQHAPYESEIRKYTTEDVKL